MFSFLLVVQAVVAAALIATILMQRSEGGGLGIGGSPSGMLSARGAADFLTRSTKWLAVAFVALSIALAAIAARGTGAGEIESTLDRDVSPVQADPLGGPAVTPAPGAPVTEPQDDPLAD